VIRLGGVTLLVALCLFASASTVHAGCAWVLWVQLKANYTAVSGHGTDQDCRLAQVEIAQGATKKGREVTTGRGIVIVTDRDGDSHQMSP
jgi:endo-1,4-beta-D-glucanase Y